MSFLEKLNRDYFKFEDVEGEECFFCESESYREIRKDGKQIILCKYCFNDLKRIRSMGDRLNKRS